MVDRDDRTDGEGRGETGRLGAAPRLPMGPTTPYDAVGRLHEAAADGRLDVLCRRHQLRVVSLFGSATRPGGAPADVDVAVALMPGTVLDELALVVDLAALTGTDAVDVAVLDRAGPVLRERALVGAVPLYEAEPGAYAEAQIAAMAARRETDWLRALDLSLLASGR